MYKTDEIELTAKMLFVSSAANDDENFENFAIFSHLRVIQAEGESGYVSGLTEFHSNNTGRQNLHLMESVSMDAS